MKKETAIKKIKLIEKNIKELKASGYSIFPIDNSCIVFENKNQTEKNIKECEKEHKIVQRSQTASYGKYFSPKQEFEYTIQLV